ncbi:MAG: sensor domain-containing diguanylate cyclase [Desulfobacterales bacterium]
MSRWEALLEQLRINEKLAARFQAIEHQILTILNFKDLFKVLLSEIHTQFGVPFVWLSLMDNSEVSDLIASLESCQELKTRLNVLPRQVFLQRVTSDIEPLLVNTHLRPYFPLLPMERNFLMGSLAILPLRLDGVLIGSLNLADPDRLRFDPGLDTEFLAQLALKVSLCLSNVTAHEKLRMLAYKDALTGLLNRRAMKSVLAREFSRAKRYGTPLSVVFIDMDGFKEINDTHGHDVGDEILRHVALQLARMCRTSDVAARFGGDEFVLILPQTPRTSAHQLMQRMVRHLVNTPYRQTQQWISSRFSYGLAAMDTPGVEDPQGLLKAADRALYTAKQTQGGRRLNG